MKKRLKDIYEIFLILTYSCNFFGTGFFYAIIITRDEGISVITAFLDMILSLMLYIKMDEDRETAFEAAKRPSFSVVIFIMYLLPIVGRLLK